MDIFISDVSATYMKGTPFEKQALHSINLHIPKGSITGIIGHTGSGKSTLIQLIAGLIFPDEGSIQVGSFRWGNKKRNLFELRKHVGLVFQYPEHQLFEETVAKDIAFGPKNFGFSEDRISNRVHEAMGMVGLSYEKLANTSPFSLSGGQMRRVAIAGVLAFEPRILILDEPTSGLDPAGRKEVLQMITKLHQIKNMTTIIVSHNMDEVANISDQLVVLNNGKILLEGAPENVFHQVELLQQVNLDIPDITKFIQKLNQKISPPIPLNCFSVDELEQHLLERLAKGKK